MSQQITAVKPLKAYSVQDDEHGEVVFAPNWRGECRIRDVSKLTLLLAGAEPVSAAA